MKRYELLAVALVAATGTATADQAAGFSEIVEDVSSLYTPVSQNGRDPLVWHTGTEKFKGDCDDYATALISRLEAAGLPYQAYIVTAREGRHKVQHVVVCSEGQCSDSIKTSPHPVGEAFYGEWRPARLVRS